MKNKKTVFYLYIIIFVLILINLTTIGFMIYMRPQGPCGLGNEGERGRPGNYLIKELKFTPEQQKQFDGLREEHHSSVCPLTEEIKNQKSIFFSELKKEQIDSLKVDSMSKLITELHRKVDLTTFWHFNKIRHLCTPQQQQRFDEIIQDGLLNTKPGPMKHLTD